MPLPVFDGHNDALTRAGADALAEGRPDGHLDLPRARAGGLGGGVFAVFTPSPGHDTHAVEAQPGGGWRLPPAPPLPHELAAAHATAAAGRLLALERRGALRVVRGVADLDTARRDGALGAVLGLEGAEAIDPGLEALPAWHALGLRVLGPVWSRDNAFARGVPISWPSHPDVGGGLTDAGVALVRACAELGILVDLSHLNQAGFLDVARLEAGPLVASHSGVHALSRCARNLTDAQLDLIGASGGLVGVVFAVGFLRDDGAEEPDTPLALIAAHARHVADRIGVAHVALGSDFDGALVPAALGDVAGLPRVLAALRDAGFTEAELERVAWGNWRRVLAATWR